MHRSLETAHGIRADLDPERGDRTKRPDQSGKSPRRTGCVQPAPSHGTERTHPRRRSGPTRRIGHPHGPASLGGREATNEQGERDRGRTSELPPQTGAEAADHGASGTRARSEEADQHDKSDTPTARPAWVDERRRTSRANATEEGANELPPMPQRGEPVTVRQRSGARPGRPGRPGRPERNERQPEGQSRPGFSGRRGARRALRRRRGPDQRAGTASMCSASP